MDNTKEMSKIAFNQQALTYDKNIKGQHARTLYPYILNMLKGRHFSSILDLGCGTGELLYQIQQIYHEAVYCICLTRCFCKLCCHYRNQVACCTHKCVIDTSVSSLWSRVE